MAKDEPQELTVDIENTGDIRVSSRAVTRRLAAAAGRWRLLPSIGDLLVWQRVDEDQRKNAPAVALSGEVDGPGALANVFNFVHFSQWDGTLALVSGATRKTLYFKRGQVLAATSNLPEERIGALLVRFGMVKEDQLAAAVREVTPQRRLGTVLVEKNLMSQADLYNGVRRQAEEIFFSALLVLRGTFYFVKQLDEAALPTRLFLDTQSLLLEGLRRIDEMSYFRAKIPSSDVILARRQPAPDADPNGEALKVWRNVDDVRTLAEIARVTHLGEFAATKAAFELIQTGYVEVRQMDLRHRSFRHIPEGALTAAAVQTVIEAYNVALAKLYAALSAKGKAGSLRQGVRAFLSGSVRFAELFRDVQLGEDGTLPKRQILANIDGIADTERLDQLQRGLNELLFFVIFVAGDAIDRAEEQAVHERVARALENLPTAPAPASSAGS
jgi:hypothetical protein